MQKIQRFLRERKRTLAYLLAGAIVAVSLLPKIASAFTLENGYIDWYGQEAAKCTWGDNSEAMQKNHDRHGGKYIPTGLAFNSANYMVNQAAIPPEMLQELGLNEVYWPLGAQMFVVMRSGYENEEFAMFHGRHTYCSGNHESAVSIQPGAQVFIDSKEGEKGCYQLPDKIYDEANKGNNPEFNFLMLVLACYYPGDYCVPEGSEVSNHDPWAAYGMVSQIITWMATDEGRPGFQGPPKGAEKPFKRQLLFT